MKSSFPRTVFLTENETTTSAEWKSLLGIDNNIFNSLVDEGIFRRSGAPGDQRRYLIVMVGALFLRDGFLFSFPKLSNIKYMNNAALRREMRFVMRLIDVYRRRRKEKSSGKFGPTDFILFGDGAKSVDRFRALVKWTEQYGFHVQEDVRSSFDEGVINWPRTLRRSFPIHSTGNVVYHEPHFVRRQRRTGALRYLQARALLDLTESFAPIAETVAAYSTEIAHESRSVLSFPPDTASGDPIRFLREFLSTANRDDERRLATLLLKHFSQGGSSSDVTYCAYGITSFAGIWQEICDGLLSHAGREFQFNANIYAPLFQGAEEPDTSWLRPDHVRIDDQKILIFDSKWMSVDVGSDEFVKQIMYEGAISHSASVRANALLVPTNNDEVKKHSDIAFVDPNGRRDRFPAIAIIEVPWRKAAFAYETFSGRDAMGQQIRSAALREGA